MANLTTTREVIKALGGVEAVANLTDRQYNAASNWNGFKTFPPDTYVVMIEALLRNDHWAPPSLWRMVRHRASDTDRAVAP